MLYVEWAAQKNNDNNKVSARRKLADYLTKLGTMYWSAAFTWENFIHRRNS